MRPALQELQKKIKNKTIFIIGGGPSIQDVDFDLLQDEITISINDAFKWFPQTTLIYWVDDSWASENYDKLKVHDCKLLFTSKQAQHISYTVNKDPRTILGATILRRTGDFGFDKQSDCVMGNNSGTQVLNLCMNMKPKVIVLLGFDMKHKGNKSHWHNMPRLPVQPKIYNNQFIPSTEALAKNAKKMGCKVDIVNACSDSALRCFRFAEYTEFLSH